MSNNNIPINNSTVESSRDMPINNYSYINPSVVPSSKESSDINSSVEHSDKEPSDINPSVEHPDKEPANQSFCNLLSDIQNSEKLNDMLTQDNIVQDMCSNLSINSTISQTADTLKNINSIKDELCKMPLDTCENQYINNSVFPLTNTLYLISTASLNLSNSVNILTTSSIVHPKKSELKDTIDLIYDMNEECADLFKVIKKRLKIII